MTLGFLDTLGLDVWAFALACAVTLFGGFVKGAVGFAMPLIMFTGLSTIMPVELALAAMIVPTVVTNLIQALRDGMQAMIHVCRLHWRFLIILGVCIVLSAQLVPRLPQHLLLLILGVPVTVLALLQLSAWKLSVPPNRRRVTEVGVAVVAGTLGGMAGTWGPPTVLYLTAIALPKAEIVRVQGVIYGAGAVMLFLAHVRSGVFNLETAPLSLAMLVPALAGMALGLWVHDRLNQAAFRRMTLIVLVIAGLNLVRRGVMGFL